MKYSALLQAPKDLIHRMKGTEESEVGDDRVHPVYVYNEELILAINVALATRRPLLIRGASGGGKSSLARNLADLLGRRYYETVITSRTTATSLLYEIDHLRRLHRAQMGKEDAPLDEDFTPFIVPGVLWWAFDAASATSLGKGKDEDKRPDPSPVRAPGNAAVVLIDEIDKADPDVPNNLLVPLGSMQFIVTETGALVRTKKDNAPLVLITTNEERELPTAFLRRCVEIKLKPPGKDDLVKIGCAHFPEVSDDTINDIAEAVLKIGNQDDAISPAEFLDTVAACHKLKISVDSDEWTHLASITISKHGRGSRA